VPHIYVRMPHIYVRMMKIRKHDVFLDYVVHSGDDGDGMIEMVQRRIKCIRPKKTPKKNIYIFMFFLLLLLYTLLSTIIEQNRYYLICF